MGSGKNHPIKNQVRKRGNSGVIDHFFGRGNKGLMAGGPGEKQEFLWFSES
jgi:hypothetical protein